MLSVFAQQYVHSNTPARMFAYSFIYVMHKDLTIGKRNTLSSAHE